MKTKIVYVVVCSEKDQYLEQAAISAFSARRYNPDAEILLLVDDRTNELIHRGRGLIKDYVSEIVEISTPNEYDNKMRSRFIKTTVRKNIPGDYLFIDTDTVITGALDEIDDCNSEVAAVLDLHVHLNETIYLEMVAFQAEKMGWKITSLDYHYYNSGVMYVKDTPMAHDFYDRWHHNWLLKAKHGLYTDQPALAYANNQCGYIIGELQGKWNCQLFVNGLPYLHNALIIHYFSSGVNKRVKTAPYYFLDSNLLDEIKYSQKFPVNFATYINSPKELAFPKGKVSIVSGEDFDVFKSDVVRFIYGQYYYHPKQYKWIKRIVELYYWLKKQLNRN